MMRQPSVSPEPTEPPEPILLLIQFQRVSSETTAGPKAVSFHNSFALNSLAYVLPRLPWVPRDPRVPWHGNLPDNHVPVLVRGAQPKPQSSPFFLETHKKSANFYLTILRPYPTVCSAHVAAIIITNQNEHANKLYQ